MKSLPNLLKTQRKALKLRSVDVAQVLRIDQALISKYENGKRLPTKGQIKPLAKLLEIPYDDLLVLFYKDLMLKHLNYDELSLQALVLVKEELEQVVAPISKSATRSLNSTLAKLDKLQARFKRLSAEKKELLNNESILSFVYHNCKNGGNTLNKAELKQIKEEGTTIAGKSIKEHFEVINQFDILKQWMKSQSSFQFDAKKFMDYHRQIYNGVLGSEAGQIKESEKIFLAQMSPLLSQMKKDLKDSHPVLVSVKFYIEFLGISPFKEANGSFANMITNAILLNQEFMVMTFNPSNLDGTIIEAENKKESIQNFCNALLLQYQKALKI